jgi:hypothetical protein
MGTWELRFINDNSVMITLKGYFQNDYEASMPFEFLVTSFDSDDKTLTVQDLGLKASIVGDINGIVLGISYSPTQANILCSEIIINFSSNENSCASIIPSEYTSSS